MFHKIDWPNRELYVEHQVAMQKVIGLKPGKDMLFMEQMFFTSV